jgi:hypothetical protein
MTKEKEVYVDPYTWGDSQAAKVLARILNEIGDPAVTRKAGNHIYFATTGLQQIHQSIKPHPVGKKILDAWLKDRIEKLHADKILNKTCKSFVENLIKTRYKRIKNGDLDEDADGPLS